ncbi:hypothetical protein VTI28DRAFT_245 [Corynascus sepedonium]
MSPTVSWRTAGGAAGERRRGRAAGARRKGTVGRAEPNRWESASRERYPWGSGGTRPWGTAGTRLPGAFPSRRARSGEREASPGSDRWG